MDAPTRHTAHTLLDFYAGFVASDDEADQRAAFETAMNDLNAGEALIAAQDDHGELTVDFTRLLLATGIAYHWLFDRLSFATGESEESLTFELRAFIDGLSDD